MVQVLQQGYHVAAAVEQCAADSWGYQVALDRTFNNEGNKTLKVNLEKTTHFALDSGKHGTSSN